MVTSAIPPSPFESSTLPSHYGALLSSPPLPASSLPFKPLHCPVCHRRGTMPSYTISGILKPTHCVHCYDHFHATEWWRRGRRGQNVELAQFPALLEDGEEERMVVGRKRERSKAKTMVGAGERHRRRDRTSAVRTDQPRMYEPAKRHSDSDGSGDGSESDGKVVRTLKRMLSISFKMSVWAAGSGARVGVGGGSSTTMMRPRSVGSLKKEGSLGEKSGGEKSGGEWEEEEEEEEACKSKE